MATYSIETNADYEQVRDANDKMVDLTTYQSYTYGKACTAISVILQQVMAQLLERNKNE